MITLEGDSRVSLKKTPKDFRQVLAGQMLDVPAGATTLPMPVNIDLNTLQLLGVRNDGQVIPSY